MGGAHNISRGATRKSSWSSHFPEENPRGGRESTRAGRFTKIDLSSSLLSPVAGSSDSYTINGVLAAKQSIN
jgi:hypothetical protein